MLATAAQQLQTGPAQAAAIAAARDKSKVRTAVLSEDNSIY